MYQIIFNKQLNRWEIKDTSDYFVDPEDTFHEYKFETEEDARGVYIHHALHKTSGFSLQYIKDTKQSS